MLQENEQSSELVTTLQKIQEALQKQTGILQELKTRWTAKKTVACYECQGPHLKRNCPQIKSKVAGNDAGPGQLVAQLSQDRE